MEPANSGAPGKASGRAMQRVPRGVPQDMDAVELVPEDSEGPLGKAFRLFAEQTKSDLKALAACLRGSRGAALRREEVQAIAVPALVATGTKDDMVGSPHELAALIPGARALDIPNRDHMLAVGDKVYKAGVLEFLGQRP